MTATDSMNTTGKSVVHLFSLNQDLLVVALDMWKKEDEDVAARNLESLCELLAEITRSKCECPKCIGLSLMSIISVLGIKDLVERGQWSDEQLQLFAKVFYRMAVCNTAMVEILVECIKTTSEA